MTSDAILYAAPRFYLGGCVGGLKDPRTVPELKLLAPLNSITKHRFLILMDLNKLIFRHQMNEYWVCYGVNQDQSGVLATLLCMTLAFSYHIGRASHSVSLEPRYTCLVLKSTQATAFAIR